MINDRPMQSIFPGGSCGATIMVLSLCVVSGTSFKTVACYAAQSAEPSWSPMPLEEIRAIWHDKPLSDTEIVRALVHHLDSRIAMSRAAERAKHRPTPAYEYGMLIGLIAERPYPAEPKGRPEAIEVVMKSLGSVENEHQVRLYLNLALGLAGGAPSEEATLRVLADQKTPEEILAVALQSMARSRVPIRSLPRLLELSGHPMGYTYAPSCVGPPVVVREFAIRDRVLDCLAKLNIRAERLMVDDGTIDASTGKPLLATQVKIDRTSLVSKLREWINDADADVWQAAIEATAKINGQDVNRMINELRSNTTLSAEKLRRLRELQR